MRVDAVMNRMASHPRTENEYAALARRPSDARKKRKQDEQANGVARRLAQLQDGEAPTPPAWIMARPEVRELWDEFVGYLLDGGALSRTDALTIERYCWAMAEWRRLVGILASLDPVDESKIYDRTARMALSMSNMCIKIEDRFGFTPLNRLRVFRFVDGDQGEDNERADKGIGEGFFLAAFSG